MINSHQGLQVTWWPIDKIV